MGEMVSDSCNQCSVFSSSCSHMDNETVDYMSSFQNENNE